MSVVRVDGEVVQPTPVTLVAGHDTSDDPPVNQSDKEQIGSDAEFAGDVFPRVVLGSNQVGLSPEVYYGLFICGREFSNLHRGSSHHSSKVLKPDTKAGGVLLVRGFGHSAGRNHPQHRRAREHHREREQRGEQTLS